MRKIDKFIIHCSDSDVESHDNIATIRKWHVEENKFSDVGYHFFIRKDGTIEVGRPLERPGAHTRGWNKRSVGVCLSGSDFFTEPQMYSCRRIYQLLSYYHEMSIHGHCEFDDDKSYCPGFDYYQEIIAKL